MTHLIVAGGGPVGLAAAIHARSAGFRVTVFEPRPYPVDKACGEGIMPPGVAELARLGVHPAGMPFVGIRYLDGPAHAEARFRAGPGLGVRRIELSRALLERALDSGVELVSGRVTDLFHGVDGVRVGRLRADWLVVADGVHSHLRRIVGGAQSPRRRRFGLRRHYRVAPWADLVEVHWAPVGEAYVTPVAPDLVGVAVLTTHHARRPGAPFDELLAAFPAVAARVAGSPDPGPVRGAGPLRARVPRRVSGRVLLIGDAAGYVDALTGEGIAIGLRTAKAAIACLAAGRPADYERAWRQITREHRVLTGALLTATRIPLARRHVVTAAGRAPWLFDAAIRTLAR